MLVVHKALSPSPGRRLLLGAALVTGLALVAPASSLAQGPPSRDQMNKQAQMRMTEMRERLSLSDEQEEQVKAIMKESAEQAKSLREQFRGKERTQETMKAMRAELQKIQKTTREKLVPVLSSEQLQEFDKLQAEWREQRRQKMQEQRGEKPGGPPGGSGGR